MLHPRVICRLALSLVAGALALPAQGQETVTIPRARLQELERKEAELETLKGELHKSRGENVQLKKQSQENTAQLPLVPAAPPVQVSPPLNTLPPLTEGETVEAFDLANHYLADRPAAEQRYRKRTFKVKGEIVGFDILPFISAYKVILKTAEPGMRIVCDVPRPEKYSAVIKTEQGEQLVGLLGGQTRVPLARVGDQIVLEGRCTGGNKTQVTLSRCELKSVIPATQNRP